MNERVLVPHGWTPRGEALADGDARPAALFGGIPGERAEFRLVHQGRNLDHGHFLGTATPDPHRVDPPCDRYALCGGCPWMHLDQGGQEIGHRALMREALDSAGLDDVGVGAWHPSPDGLGSFRHVAKVGFGWSDQGRVRVGAWGRRDRRIVPIPKCTVAVPALRQTMTTLAHFTLEHDIRPFDGKDGLLRAAVLRASRTTGEVLVTLISAKRAKILGDLAEDLAGHVSAVAGIWVHLNSDPNNVIFSRDETGNVPVRALIGKATIEEDIGGIRYSIGPGDFFQTNPAMAEVLYQRTLDLLELAPEVPVVDLYSGVGGVALQAARVTGWALGVEEVDGAVARARETARRHGLAAEFVSGRVEAVLPELGKRLGDSRPVVVVNPARRGLEEGVGNGILALRPRSIAYISCNPRALARDLAAFRDAGYRVGDVELFEMFPNTPHVECLVRLDSPAPAPEGARGPRRKVVRGG